MMDARSEVERHIRFLSDKIGYASDKEFIAKLSEAKSIALTALAQLEVAGK